MKLIEDPAYKIGTFIDMKGAEAILDKYPDALKEFQTGRSQYLKKEVISIKIDKQKWKYLSRSNIFLHYSRRFI